jgi:L-asparagine transporter-like permease
MSSQTKGKLTMWHLVLLGLAFTTGTGFFLGSSIAIQKSGFSVLFLLLLAAFGTFFVFDALARMIADDPKAGSFRSYSKKAFGHWAGFSHGWIYWISEILILGSQLTAIGLFAQFWFPDIPLWLIATVFASLGVGIVLLGTSGFETMEDFLAIVKISAIIMFIIIGGLTLTGFIGTESPHMHTSDPFFSGGLMGMWTGLIFVFFAFAGIEVMGIMASQLKNPKDAPKAGKIMISIVTTLFILSIGLALLLAPLESFSTEESPFVTALKDIKFIGIVHVFNGVLIIAGFSSLVASLFAVTQMMYTIAKDGDAPKFFAKKGKRNVPYRSLGLTILGMVISIVAALLLPKKVYEYITTAGGLMLLYTWLFMIFASRKLLKLSSWGQTKSFSAIILILITTSGTFFDETTRPGLFVSLVFLLIIVLVTFLFRKRWNKEGDDEPIFWKRWARSLSK